MKLKMTFAAALVAMASNVSAANYLVSNVVTGDSTGDALFQNVNGTLLSGGIVALGYFETTTPSSNLADIATTISNFTLKASALTNTYSVDLDGSYPGYVQAAQLTGAAINNGNPLISRPMYVFVGNASTLAASTAWALAKVAIISSDEPVVQNYIANPMGVTATLGSIGTYTGSAGGTSGTYQTLKLAAIPEPSAAVFGLMAAGGLVLRRRRA